MSLVLETEAEHGLEVVRRELLKGDHRLGPLDAVEPGKPLCDHLGEIVVLAHADDGDEVPLAGNRVDLGDARDVSKLRAELRQAFARRLDQNEGSQHAVQVTV